jgi:hypothetical protein
VSLGQQRGPVIGVHYLIFVTSIVALVLYQPVHPMLDARRERC